MAKKLKVMGIYLIRSTTTGLCYVGSSVNVNYRWLTHCRSLRSNTHHSRYLQRAWNKYGEHDFEFEVCELVTDRDDLVIREQCWIDRVGAYNVSRFADRPTPPPMTAEMRQRISDSMKGRPGTMLGKKHDLATREWMSNTRKGVRFKPDHGLKVSLGKTGMPLSEDHKAKLRVPKSDATKLLFRFASALRWMQPGHIPSKARDLIIEHPVAMLDFCLNRLNTKREDILRLIG